MIKRKIRKLLALVFCTALFLFTYALFRLTSFTDIPVSLNLAWIALKTLLLLTLYVGLHMLNYTICIKYSE